MRSRAAAQLELWRQNYTSLELTRGKLFRPEEAVRTIARQKRCARLAIRKRLAAGKACWSNDRKSNGILSAQPEVLRYSHSSGSPF